MKKILKAFGILLLIIVVFAAGFIGYLSFTEYSPDPQAPAEVRLLPETARDLSADEPLTILSWNIGYCGLDAGADFFMDGGSMVYPTSQEAVENNLAKIHEYISQTDAQIVLLQEVDRDSSRSGGIDELDTLLEPGMGYAYAPNYRCAYVPFPLPPIGRVESGVVTMFERTMSGEAIRVSLPCPFSWPMRVANLKRCLLITRFPVDDKELVMVNFHLEAYDDGEGKIAQTKMLMEILEKEYAAGNYVIAGGDFNQTFPGGLEKFPVQSEELWAPGTLDADQLPAGWRFANDLTTASCRSLDRPLDLSDPTMQYYVIDGFLVSPNVTVNSIETQDLGFANSDHNPVILEVSLGERG